MEILFVRHGESEANVLELMYGSSDYSLTDLGKEQALGAGKIIELMGFIPDHTYVSTLKRAHETLSGGESQLDFESRIISFLKDLEKTYQNGEKLLVVSHGGTMKTIFSYIFKSNPEQFFNIEIHNCSIMRVTKSKKSYVFDALYNIHDFEGLSKKEDKSNHETI